ncbi:MAG: ROK family transcriptional regulator [Boseongicola sp. SB0675_bin_26]|nr:ROK family transcriptional regulator [Boseongicola sp. SB0675_bin_26]
MNHVHNPSSELRRTNRAAVLRILANHGAASRAEICEALNLTPAGLSRIARELIDADLVVEGTVVNTRSGAGRRAGNLTINPNGAFVLGVSITANRRNVALANAAGEVLEQIDISGVDASDPDKTLSAILAAAKSLASPQTDWGSWLAGAGVSVATTGKISPDGDTSIGVLGWRNVPIGRWLGDQLGLPVTVTSRADSLVQAEFAKSAEAGARIFLINVGLGIGCAWLGADGTGQPAPDLGNVAHIPNPVSDAICHCGRRGCYQVTGSGIAVVRSLAALADDATPPLADLSAPLAVAVRAADGGDLAAKSAFHAAGAELARAVDIAHNLLAPDLVYLAGETGRQADFVAGVRDGLTQIGALLPPDAVRISDIRTVEAAASAALHAFVFSRDVDLARLKAA